jgi:hypothetical protein
MRRFTTAFALLTIALTAAACDPYQALQGKVPGSPQANDDLSINAHVLPGAPEPHISNTPDVNIPADVPNTNR